MSYFEWFILMNLLEKIELHANQKPTSSAITSRGETISYEMLWNKIQSISANLISRGVQKNDRFLFSVRPSVDFICFALGIVAAGGTVVFIEPGVSPNLFKKRLETVKPRYAVTESVFYLSTLPLVKSLVKQKNIPVINYLNVEGLELFHTGKDFIGIPKRSVNIKHLMKPNLESQDFDIDGDAEAIIAFTSGTFEKPNAVIHSLNTLSAGMEDLAFGTHLHSLSNVLTTHLMYSLTTLYKGAWLTLPSYSLKNNEKEWIKEALSDNWSHAFLIPADIVEILDYSEKNPSNKIQITNLITGAAPVLPSLLNRISRVLPKSLTFSVYGLTEMFPVSIVLGNAKFAYGNCDFAGRPVDNARVRIHKPDSKGVGEIVISGESLMLGYLGQKKTIEHYTGDIGKIVGDDGSFALVGRKKDMFIRGDKNLYPHLYEPSIMEIYGVNDCTLVGLSDVYGDDLIILFIEASVGKHFEITQNVKEVMDDDAMPDEIVFIEELPYKGRSRRPDRESLRKKALELPKIQEILEFRKGTL